MENIIILDDMSYMRYRVKELLQEKNVRVYEASTSFEFFNKLYEKKDNIDLIILEVGLTREDGFQVVERIREKNINIPIVILTKMNTRDAFAKAVKEGVSDYILKPFDNKLLLDRIMKTVKEAKLDREEIKKENIVKYEEKETKVDIEHKKHINKDNNVVVHKENEELPEEFKTYFVEKLNKAKTENVNLSSILFTLIKNTKKEEKIDIKESYIILTDVFYKGIKDIFKIPNFISKYGLLTFVTVLPNCDKSGIEDIKNKIVEKYNMLSLIYPKLSEYHVEYAEITYPSDGESVEELLNILMKNMKENIKQA